MTDLEIRNRIGGIKDYKTMEYCLDIYMSYQWKFGRPETYKEIYKRVDRISKIKNIKCQKNQKK